MRIAPLLAPYLAQDRWLLLDGGLATELEHRGHDLSDALWSARLLRDAPEEIRAVHETYFEAGAQVAISASYQASHGGFAREGYDAQEADRLLRLSVALAREARGACLERGGQASGSTEHHGRTREINPRAVSSEALPLVAASIGPYGATLADGSEYTGKYDLDRLGLADFHRRRLEVLAAAGADILACETIPSCDEVEAIVEVLDALPESAPPAWLSVTCRDGALLHDGTPIEVAAARAQACARIVAFGLNCVAPEQVTPLLLRAANATDLPLVAYPNRGERWDAGARCWEGGSGWRAAAFVEAAREWRELGARLIGGCCRTGPAEIEALAVALGGGGPDGIEGGLAE